jgi:hypothetical protein
MMPINLSSKGLVMIQSECLMCGMPTEQDLRRLISSLRDLPVSLNCLKCDDDLVKQTDGSTLIIDIAHHHETVTQSMDKLEKALLLGWQSTVAKVRLIVGGGRIREEVLVQLQYYQELGYFQKFMEEIPNHGAVIVHLRHA